MNADDDLSRRIASGVPDERRGDLALVSVDARLRYGDLLAAIDAAAAEIGRVTQAGDRVLVHLPNGVESVVMTLATMAAGRVAVALSSNAGAERTKMALAVTEPSCMLTTSLPEGLDPSTLPRVTLRPRIDREGALQFDALGETAGESAGESRSETPAADAPADEAAMILFSSGSTGVPKGVVLRRAGLAWTATTLARQFGIDATHRELILGPLVHSGAWQRTAATLVSGGTVVLSDGNASIAGLFEDVALHGITGFYTPPPLIRYLLKIEPERARSTLASIRTLEIGSAPIAEDEVRALLELLPDVRVFVHYGLIECSRAAVLDARAHPDKLGTVGCAISEGELAVRNAAGDACAPGEVGEVWVRGPQIGAGYQGDLQATAARFVDGWVRTQDQGALDAEGFLTFAGRDDDRIDHAGFHFFPVEVEKALGPVPGVSDYVVAGVPDPRGMLGDLPCAFVVAEQPKRWTPVTFGALARRRLPPHMVPRTIVLVPELPRTATGKSDRRETVERYGQKAR